MPPLFRSTSVGMKDEIQARRRDLRWGLPASLALHVLIIAFLIYGLPRPLQRPQEEQAVNVALVPPPVQPKPKPPVPALKEPKREKQSEPKVEKPPEQQVKKQPPPEKQPPKSAPIEVLKPVFQFGAKDAGPRKSLDGGSAQDKPPSPAKDEASKPTVTAEDEKPAEAGKDSGKQAASTQQDGDKQEAAKQDAEARDTAKQSDTTSPPLAAAGSDGEIALPASAEAPRPRPANMPKPRFAKGSKPGGGAGRPSSTDVANAIARGYSGLPGVRKLYSQGATGDALATSAMAGVPRDRRAAKLCASELQQRLLNASYFPDLIPLVPLKAGNLLDVPEAAFHTQTTWYRLSFRCEVDNDATRVLSFDFRVGTAIPPDEWARLGLPVGD
jgi:hypothetical protein